MSYISDLRKIVGKRTLIMPCSAVIVLNEKNEILLQKRKDNNLWALHGGAIEIDEDIFDAARREMYEETGLIADDLEFFKVYSGKKNHHIYPNGDEVYIIENIFICKKYHGELKVQQDEVKELKYFAFSSLPKEMMLRNKEIIIDYLKTKGDY